jgi:hypothetical protein
MLNQHEAYRRKAESFEKVARRLRDRTDPVGRKLFSFAERTARRFRHLAETLAALEEQRTRPCPKSTRFASSEFRFGPSRDNATIDLLTHGAFLLDRGAVSPIAVGRRGVFPPRSRARGPEGTPQGNHYKGAREITELGAVCLHERPSLASEQSPRTLNPWREGSVEPFGLGRVK